MLVCVIHKFRYVCSIGSSTKKTHHTSLPVVAQKKINITYDATHNEHRQSSSVAHLTLANIHNTTHSLPIFGLAWLLAGRRCFNEVVWVYCVAYSLTHASWLAANISMNLYTVHIPYKTCQIPIHDWTNAKPIAYTQHIWTWMDDIRRSTKEQSTVTNLRTQSQQQQQQCSIQNSWA